jgi:hypothetical protein
MITPNHISIISIRILSLYLILQGLSILPTFTRISSSELFLLDPQYILIILGIIIWILAKPISKFIVGKETIPHDSTNTFSINQIEVFIFSIVGLILLVHAIPQLFSLITYRKVVATLNLDPVIEIQALATFKSSLVYNIVKIFIGLYLLCFSKHFTDFVNKIRNKIRKPNLTTN